MSNAPLAHTQSMRRSATLPTKLIPRKQRSSDSLNSSGDILFYHPSAKIVHFAPRALAPIPSSTSPADFDYPVDTIETLPWRSPTERTVAFAPLRLERGLTVFLKCGNVVHAILKNSQCWCVDGESTFVLRIRPLTYYRIELPNGTKEDKTSVVELKGTLPNILRYEITPCPFKRGFTVEIPLEAMAPRRRRAWQPKGRISSAPVPVSRQESSPVRKDDSSDVSSVGEDAESNATDDSGFTKGSNSTTLETIPDDQEPSSPVPIPERLELPKRSVTETQQSFQTLLARFEDSSKSQVDPEATFSSSAESFHSLESPSSPHPPSTSHSASTCPTSVDGSEPVLGFHNFGRDEWEKLTFKEPASPTEDTDFESASTTYDDDFPQTPGSYQQSPPQKHRLLPSALPHVETAPSKRGSAATTTDLSDMSAQFRRRAKASRERDISPMPPPSTLSTYNPGKQDTTSIIKNTCTLVLVPPVQLLIVLIHIAARIVIGPALNSALEDLNNRIEYEVTNPQDTVDDFDLPLAPASDNRRASETREPKPSGSWP